MPKEESGYKQYRRRRTVKHSPMMGTVKYYNLFQLKESMDPMYEVETG